MRLEKFVWMAFLLAIASAAPQQQASTKGTPQAQAEAAKGAAALRTNDWDTAVAHYRKAIDLDPDFFEAHEQYVFVCTAGPVNYTNEKLHQELEAQYLQWAKQHPDKAVYPYVLGHIYQYKKPDLGVQYFEQAVKIDPKFAPAWDELGICAEAQGKLAEEREYERKAAEAWPENVRYARHSVDSWMMGDFATFKKLSLEFTAKYPGDAVSQLGYLALRAYNYEDSRAVYEIMRQKYASQSAGQLPTLFQMYLREDVTKALDLAHEMAKLNPTDKQWQQLVIYAQTVADARDMIAAGKAQDALAALDKVTLPPRADRRMLEVMRAKALYASGQPAEAYSGLVKTFAAKPNDEVRSSLVELGKKLGKEPRQVDAEVFTQRGATARAGIPFSTVTYPDGKPVSLDGLKGKVFLLNFWYPLCGPCRGEFPFLQGVLDKYKSRGFQIVAANGHPLEDAWVMPLIKGWNLGFLPVKGGADLDHAYGVKGYPSNFLYGGDGRIYYVPGPVNTYDARRELELQIEALLDRNGK